MSGQNHARVKHANTVKEHRTRLLTLSVVIPFRQTVRGQAKSPKLGTGAFLIQSGIQRFRKVGSVLIPIWRGSTA
jgi:hypothetical protein